MTPSASYVRVLPRTLGARELAPRPAQFRRRWGARCDGSRPMGCMTHDDAATILLVEDDDATRTFLADNLTADGYDLLVADCVSDGLRLLERKFPDAALVDLGLPDASGYELLRRVRAADGVASRVDPDTPLMVLDGPLLGARPHPRLRPRRRRLRLQAVLLSGAARPPRGAAAPSRPQPRAHDVARRRAGGRSAVARGAPARRAGDPVAEGVRAAAHAHQPADAGLHEGRSCCARSGATAAPARRARSIPTPAACARSSAAMATATS